MLSLFLYWIVTALILLLAAYILPGVDISGFGTAMIAALVMGVVNVLIRPLLTLLTLPINFLTLGLFAFVINAMMFALVAWLVPGFDVHSFWSALLGSLLLALMTSLIGNFDRRAHA